MTTLLGMGSFIYPFWDIKKGASRSSPPVKQWFNKIFACFWYFIYLCMSSGSTEQNNLFNVFQFSYKHTNTLKLEEQNEITKHYTRASFTPSSTNTMALTRHLLAIKRTQTQSVMNDSNHIPLSSCLTRVQHISTHQNNVSEYAAQN